MYVGSNPLLEKPTVWLTDGPRLCQAVLGVTPAPTVVSEGAAKRPAGDGGAAITNMVEAIDANSFRLDRRLLTLAMGGGREFDSALRGVQGRLTADGFHLGRVPPGSLPAALGLKSGDRLTAVNGRALSGAEGLMAVYSDVMRGGRTKLTIVREGQTRDMQYEFD